MTIPASLMSAGVAKTLRDTMVEFKDRLFGKGAAVYEGLPDPTDLPDDQLQHWIAPTSFDGNDNGVSKSFNQTSIYTTWSITIIRTFTGRKRHGVDMNMLMEDMGRFMENLTSTIDNMTLSGEIEWLDEPRGQFEFPPAAAVGDRCIGAVTFELGVHHGPDPTRCQT